MRVIQYYLLKSLPPPPPLCPPPPPPAECNKAKELTQTQTARICLIILCAIILPLQRTHGSLSLLSVRLGHRQTLSLLQQWYKPSSGVSLSPSLSPYSLLDSFSKFEVLLEGGNLPAQIAHKLTTGRGGEGRGSKYFIRFQACAGTQGLACVFLSLIVSISSVNPSKRGSSDWRSRRVHVCGQSSQRLSRAGVEVLIKI